MLGIYVGKRNVTHGAHPERFATEIYGESLGNHRGPGGNTLCHSAAAPAAPQVLHLCMGTNNPYRGGAVERRRDGACEGIALTR